MDVLTPHDIHKHHPHPYIIQPHPPIHTPCHDLASHHLHTTDAIFRLLKDLNRLRRLTLAIPKADRSVETSCTKPNDATSACCFCTRNLRHPCRSLFLSGSRLSTSYSFPSPSPSHRSNALQAPVITHQKQRPPLPPQTPQHSPAPHAHSTASMSAL